MFLHSNIKFLRTYTHLTQSEFGRLFGKTRSNIDSYERGSAKPDEATQKKIADHYNIQLETLIHKDIQKNPGLLLANSSFGDQSANLSSDVLKAKDELIKELRSQLKYLQEQNEQLLKKLPRQ